MHLEAEKARMLVVNDHFHPTKKWEAESLQTREIGDRLTVFRVT